LKVRRAVSIEWLLDWVYRRQRADEITGRSLSRSEAAAAGETWTRGWTTSGDGCLRIQKQGIIGRKIDGGPPIRGIPEALHVDAETTHEIIIAMPWLRAALLIRFGKTGLAPEPPPPPKFKATPIYDGRRWKAMVRKRYDRALRCSVTWTPISVWPDEQVAGMLAEQYRIWQGALQALRGRLSEIELRDFEVGGEVEIAAE
jgi:hypothetical protein